MSDRKPRNPLTKEESADDSNFVPAGPLLMAQVEGVSLLAFTHELAKKRGISLEEAAAKLAAELTATVARAGRTVDGRKLLMPEDVQALLAKGSDLAMQLKAVLEQLDRYGDQEGRVHWWERRYLGRLDRTMRRRIDLESGLRMADKLEEYLLDTLGEMSTWIAEGKPDV